LPAGGGSALLIVEALGADGSGVETAVTLSASGGELGTSQLQTDRTGHATGSWVGHADRDADRHGRRRERDLIAAGA
jgi:hypothetical protein